MGPVWRTPPAAGILKGTSRTKLCGGDSKVAEIVVKDFDSFETALRRFKKKVQDAGLLQEMRKREYYEAPSVRRKKKLLAAIRKERRRQKRENASY